MPVIYNASRMLVTVPDLENLRGTALSEFDRRTATISRDGDETLLRESARLEGQLEAIYRIGVLAQRREPEMEAALAVWDALVKICDSFLARLEALKQDFPACAASYDKMLDLRLAAEKRRDLHRKPGP